MLGSGLGLLRTFITFVESPADFVPPAEADLVLDRQDHLLPPDLPVGEVPHLLHPRLPAGLDLLGILDVEECEPERAEL